MNIPCRFGSIGDTRGVSGIYIKVFPHHRIIIFVLYIIFYFINFKIFSVHSKSGF